MPGITHQGPPVQYEDTPHVSGHAGVMALGVRNDAGTAFSPTTGDYVPVSMDAAGNARVNVAASITVPSSEIWRVTNISNVTPDSSNKTFTVPANTEYQILFIRVNLATTATVGIRQVVVRVEHPAATLTGALARAAATQTASLTREYTFASGLADLSAFRDTDFLTTPLPNGTVLYAGDVLRVYDNKAIDAAADDMLVYIQLASRTV